MTPSVPVRAAGLADMPELLRLAAAFVASSAHGFTFDPAGAETLFRHYLDRDDMAVLVVERGDGTGLAGGAIVGVMRDFTIEPSAFVLKFFVETEARGRGVSRALVRAVAEFADAHGCAFTFATATAGMGPRTERLFMNLFAREGFAPVGPTLGRPVPV